MRKLEGDDERETQLILEESDLRRRIRRKYYYSICNRRSKDPKTLPSPQVSEEARNDRLNHTMSRLTTADNAEKKKEVNNKESSPLVKFLTKLFNSWGNF